MRITSTKNISPTTIQLNISGSVIDHELTQLRTRLNIRLLAHSAHNTTLARTNTAFHSCTTEIYSRVRTTERTVLPTKTLRNHLQITTPLSFNPARFTPMLTRVTIQRPRLRVRAYCDSHFISLVTRNCSYTVHINCLRSSGLVTEHVNPVGNGLITDPNCVGTFNSPRGPRRLVTRRTLVRDART